MTYPLSKLAFIFRPFSIATAKNSLRTGFSLVEVVLALGICSFVLITVMGLMTVALQSSKQAVQITQSGKIVQAVSSHLLQAGYDNLAALDGQSGANAPSWAYDYDGVESNQTENPEYFTTRAIGRVGLLLPGATAPNTNIMRFQLVTAPEGRTPGQLGSITNVVTVADTGY